MLTISSLLILLVIILPITIIWREFYLISIISIPFFIFVILKYKVNIGAKFKFKSFLIVSSIYSIYIITLTFYINSDLILFSLNKCTTLMFFVSVLIYLCNFDNNIEKIKLKLVYSIVFIVISSIILYLFNIDGINIGRGINITRAYSNLNLYGERRVSWMFEHKLHFAAVCLIGIYFTNESNKLTIKKKLIFNIIMLMAIFLSNSMMSLLGVFAIYVYGVIKKIYAEPHNYTKNKALLIKYFKLCVLGILIVFGALVAIKILAYIGKTRNLDTLGSRTEIWELAINDIKNNPVGIIKSYGRLLNNGYSIYSTAHNIFLNELLETGLIGGGLYAILIVIAYSMISKPKNKYIFLIIIFLAQFDYLISGIFAYIFWLVVAILIVNNKESVSKEVV